MSVRPGDTIADVHPSTELARDIVDGLVVAGMRHVVLAPGSRSAPLAYELLAAERRGLLTLHVRVDERAAAFLALGLGKVSRRPAAVVTTSGTAVANLHPAVLEAHHGLVPLVVISADRPAELRGIGANQTTVQPGIFGAAVRAEAELGAEDDAEHRRRIVADLISTSRAADSPGPVHLNVALREPLVPDLTDPVRADWPAPQDVAVAAADTSGEVRDLPDRTLVIIGDLPEPGQARRVAHWAAARGWPVVAEPFGEQPVGPSSLPHGPLLLGTAWFEAHRPDCIVVAGRVTLSRSVRRVVTADPDRVTYLSAGPRWLGPSFEVARTLSLDVVDTLSDPTTAAAPSSDSRWLRAWQDAAVAVGDAIRSQLPWGSGPGLARLLTSALPDGATLVVGSSNSVRDLELAADWGAAAERSVRVVANRGLAGIDGVVSTAVGVALASGEPTWALVGDLTFLHDSNALLIGPDEQRADLTVVVANDDGGGIFSTLEPGEPERDTDFERIFATATGARIADLAAAYRIGYARADSSDRLAELLGQRPEGIRIIEVPIDRSGHRALRERLRELADEATR